MSSLRKITSCRANGARSKGPTTEEGRRTASRNAMRHGLLADCVLLPDEDPANFESLLEEHLVRFRDLDGVEFGMVEEMAAAYWRLRRVWTIEKAMFAEAMSSQPAGNRIGRDAFAFRKLAATPELALLHRYEARLHLMYGRALNNLLKLGAGLKPEDTTAREETLDMPNGPNPDSGHPAPSESLTPSTNSVPANPQAAEPDTPADTAPPAPQPMSQPQTRATHSPSPIESRLSRRQSRKSRRLPRLNLHDCQGKRAAAAR